MSWTGRGGHPAERKRKQVRKRFRTDLNILAAQPPQKPANQAPHSYRTIDPSHTQTRTLNTTWTWLFVPSPMPQNAAPLDVAVIGSGFAGLAAAATLAKAGSERGRLRAARATGRKGALGLSKQRAFGSTWVQAGTGCRTFLTGISPTSGDGSMSFTIWFRLRPLLSGRVRARSLLTSPRAYPPWRGRSRP